MLASLWMVFRWGLPRAQKVDSEVIRMCNGGILTTTVQFANVGIVFLFSIASAPRSTRYSESWQKDTFQSAFRHPLACFRSHPDGLHNKYSVINSIQTYIYHCGMDAQGGKNRSLCLLPSSSVNSMDVRLCNTWNDFIAVGSSLDLRAFQWLNSAQSRKYIQRTKSFSSCYPLFHTG